MREYRPAVCSQGRGRGGVVWEPADQRGGVERGGEAPRPGHRTRLRLCGDRPWPSGTRVKKHLPASWDAASFLPPLQSARAKSPASSPHPRRGRSLAVFWRTCWPISRRIGIHVIVDHSSPPKRNDDWLAQFQGRVRLHFTPTSASWLNQREIVFRLLQPKTLHGGNLKSQDPLREAIEACLRKHDERARTFRWRKREVRGSRLRNTITNLRN